MNLTYEGHKKSNKTKYDAVFDYIWGMWFAPSDWSDSYCRNWNERNPAPNHPYSKCDSNRTSTSFTVPASTGHHSKAIAAHISLSMEKPEGRYAFISPGIEWP